MRLRRLAPLLVGVVAAAVLPGACSSHDGFRCGVPSSDDPSVIPSCDGWNQVCICDTGRCAERVDKIQDDAGYPPTSCSSGFRYLDLPFGEPGKPCVDVDDAASAVDQRVTQCAFPRSDASPDQSASDAQSEPEADAASEAAESAPDGTTEATDASDARSESQPDGPLESAGPPADASHDGIDSAGSTDSGGGQ